MLAHSKGEAEISTRLARKVGPDATTGDEVTAVAKMKKRKVNELNEQDQHDEAKEMHDEGDEERETEEDDEEDTDSSEEVEIDWDDEAYWEQLRRREKREERRKRRLSHVEQGEQGKEKMSPRAEAELKFVLGDMLEGKVISGQVGPVGTEDTSKKSSYLTTVHKESRPSNPRELVMHKLSQFCLLAKKRNSTIGVSFLCFIMILNF